MIRRCSICKRVLGEKEPLSDTRYTDGYCDDCFASEMKEIENFTEQRNLSKNRKPSELLTPSASWTVLTRKPNNQT